MSLRVPFALSIAVSVIPACSLQPQSLRELRPGGSVDATLTPTTAHDYQLLLSSGESVDLVVQQIGVDIVVEVRDPAGRISSFDSPNGRNGPEPVEIIADRSGLYSLRVRAFDTSEPTGKYHLQVNAWRNARETTALLRSRELARDSATRWLAARSAPIPPSGIVAGAGSLAPLDSLAARARVIALGEATHGSKEFNDFRISATRRLIERNGFRLIAIEASTARLDVLNKYIHGEIDAGPLFTRALESGWIGRRAQRDLVRWLRGWNAAHRSEQVSLIGVDPQDNEIARDSLVSFLGRAYGSDFVDRLAPMFREFAAADSQTLVFGNSSIDSTARAASMELLATLELDAAVLSARFGTAAVEASRSTARQLVEFAEFNAWGAGILNRSRDYFMALNLFDALARAGGKTKAVYWAHNSHVAHTQNRSANGTTAGGWLRQWLGCDYAAIGASFGEGAFVVQMPNDLTDRLWIAQLPPSPAESIDAVLSKVRAGGSIATWPCRVDPVRIPGWLSRAQRMHWAGGLLSQSASPSESFRSFDLLRDFDAVYIIPRVSADEMPTDRPIIPGRKR